MRVALKHSSYLMGKMSFGGGESPQIDAVPRREHENVLFFLDMLHITIYAL